ncbi:MAG: aminopeptidase, partial [Pseudomonadota bacterium]
DFYDDNDQFTVTNKERNEYQEFLAELEDWEREAMERALNEDKNYYVMEFNNHGGLVMPILLHLTFENGAEQELVIPAEIWRRNARTVKKLIVTEKELSQVEIDRHWQTADTDVENNHFPRRIVPSRIEIFKDPDKEGMEYRDIMQDSKTELETGDEE